MVDLYGQQWTRAQLVRQVGHLDQIAGIKLVEAADGSERGARLFEVWTGSGLTFHVSADRALDISACAYNGMALAWRSSVGDSHPAFTENRELEWLRAFPGGLLATCGLDQYGAPNVDNGEPLSLHGRLGSIPARYANYRTYWQDDEYMLEISGEMRQTRVFGENLVLRRTITTRMGSSVITIHDRVTNEGFAPHPHMLLYHFNLGWPLLSADARLVIDADETQPRDAVAEVGLADWSRFQPPTPGYREQVFRHRPRADAAGFASVQLENPALGLGLRWRYDTSTLPYVFQWKQMGEGVYVLGVEPANCGVIQGRATARERGDLPILQPRQTREYHLEVEVISV